MIPDGNCRDSSESCGVVNKNETIPPWNDYIMREFILYDHVDHDGGFKIPRT